MPNVFKTEEGKDEKIDIYCIEIAYACLYMCLYAWIYNLIILTKKEQFAYVCNNFNSNVFSFVKKKSYNAILPDLQDLEHWAFVV